ncbi:OmpA family protein [Hymenobacter sp. BT770]|uniref:OmpA family protein n=1 Tax=Hymenobacter sp. BT770 TaxID=2886942 RepID=UPI001D10250C|nr:OmpA family protein [Hymenobacter sp. BT770]MCC3152210.1 OmpA family protein [Hymenobacter sp. BT770]MDO3414024.1 OmpA family protein [Hymenobacter sp. BT770]
MNNLLDSIKALITPDLVSGLAGRLGENQGGVSKGLSAALPLVLAGLIQKVGGGDGAQSVFSMAQTAYQQHGSSLGAPTGLLGMLSGSNAGSPQAGNMLTSIFGGQASNLATPLSSHAGISSGSASSLLSLAGMAVPALLGRHIKQNNLNASSMGSMLIGLKDQVMAMLPSGMGALLGGLGAAASRMGGAAAGAGGNLGSAMTNPAGEPRRQITPAPGGGGTRWPLILGALAVLALLFFFTRSCNKTTTTTTTTETTPMVDTTNGLPKPVAPAVSTGLDSASAALKAGWAKLGAMTAIKLRDGSTINAPANGVESKLVAFINDKSRPVDKTTWFSLDRLLFKTASAELLPDSQEQLDNLAAILKAYPAVKLKLGGYTDSRGDAALNRRLSGERAKTVLNRLVAAGIAADRLASEGYGPEHPVASNSTPEGRQQNRRVDVRVTAK